MEIFLPFTTPSPLLTDTFAQTNTPFPFFARETAADHTSGLATILLELKELEAISVEE
jgi:hypothetical protein